MNANSDFRANEAIVEFYVDGDVDYIFFGQLISCMTSYVDEDGEEDIFSKAPNKVFEDALILAEYLIDTGDFSAGRTINENGAFRHTLMDGGFDELKRCVTAQFEVAGLDDVDLRFTTWLQKNEKGKQPKAIPQYIAALFD